MGLVSQVFDESTLESLKGHVAVGHARYSTTGASTWHNAQPTFRPTETGSIALAHNGNLTNTRELAEARRRAGRDVRRARPARSSTDAHVDQRHQPCHGAARAPPRPEPGGERRPRCSPQLEARSPSSGWTRTRCTPPATRRASVPWSSAGSSAAGSSPPRRRRSTSWARRSSARWSRARWSRSTRTACAAARFAEPAPKHCLFEFVYLARPDTLMNERRVHSVRVEIGRRLAREFPAEADLVMPGAGVRHAGRDRLRRGERHPLRHRPGQELLRRPHVHPAVADHPPARHPAQAQPARATSSRASGSSSSTTRSCAATPSAPWSGCCARPVRARSTCGSPARR